MHINRSSGIDIILLVLVKKELAYVVHKECLPEVDTMQNFFF